MAAQPSHNFLSWPSDAIDLDIDEVIDLYNTGFAGALEDPEAVAAFAEEMEWKNFGSAAIHFGLEESGAGKLSIPYQAIIDLVPNFFPGPAQTTGCCVSRGTTIAGCLSTYIEVSLRVPDPVTGVIEGPPPLLTPQAGEHQVFSHEVIYWNRGHRGQGANCATLAKTVKDVGGLLPRNVWEIPGYGSLDVSRYDDRLAARSGPSLPSSIGSFIKEHGAQVRTVTQVNSYEEARDALANGYGINVCSGFACASTRPTVTDSKGNECAGPNDWRGSWAHAMGWTACDDRPETKSKFGEGLILIQNSWAKWNSGPRRIFNSDHLIPEGSFWIKASTANKMLRGGGGYAFSNVSGFPGRKISHLFV